ncbi:MAG: hypothetical protein ABFE01_28645 [Phycisphaerales bacterium]
MQSLQLKTAALAEELQMLSAEEQALLTATARVQAELARVRGAGAHKDMTNGGRKTHGK